MKKRIAMYALTVCLLLSGCSGARGENASPGAFFTGEEPLTGFDAQNQYMLSIAISFQEGEGFFCGSDLIGNLIRYYDRASGVSGVLCADPACTHDSSSCGAYMRSGATLSYYDGKLYWVVDSQDNGDSYLCRGDLSGDNREKVKRISFEDVILPYQPQRYAIHRGNLYILGNAGTVQGVEAGKRVTLLSSSLDGTEEFRILYDETFSWGVYTDFRFVGNQVYFFRVSIPKDGPADTSVIRYDMTTGAVETVYEETGIEKAPPGGFWVMDAGEIYFSGRSEECAYLWKLENGQRVEAASWSGGSFSSPFLLDGIVLWVTQKDGQRLAEVQTLSGEPVYSGKLFPEEIPGLEDDPEKYSFAVIGGDTDKIILNLQSFTDSGLTDYTLMLDLHDNLKPTVLWSGQK